MVIKAGSMNYSGLNRQIKDSPEKEILLREVIGQRYIGCGIDDKRIEIHGTPGNALGAFLNGGTIDVFGNAQDATGDTMNKGRIIIHGNCGDTTGYGMRGGGIFIERDAGYRMGIHMKEYRENKPVIVVGGKTGDFLGEYQAGGIIIVLGIGAEGRNPVGKHCGTGMHGGVIYLRSDVNPEDLPEQVNVSEPTEEDKKIIEKYVKEFCKYFKADKTPIFKSRFIKLTANTRNPYRQLYTMN